MADAGGATLVTDGTPTLAIRVAGGRSAATFALLAGVALAFLSGGRQAVHGRERTTVSAGPLEYLVTAAARWAAHLAWYPVIHASCNVDSGSRWHRSAK